MNGVEISRYLIAINTLALFDNVAIDQITYLNSGQCNVNFKVEQGGQAFVVRFCSHFDQINPRNRQQECLVQQLAADHQLAPSLLSHVHLADLIKQDATVWSMFDSMFSGVMVSEFVTGGHWDLLNGSKALNNLATAMAKLHQIPSVKPELLWQVSLPKQLNHYWQCYVDSYVDTFVESYVESKGPVIDHIKNIVTDLTLQLSNVEQGNLCLIHGDLNPSNIMVSDHLIFIDWEYGGYGDRYLDLASVIVEFELRDKQRHLLLSDYSNKYANDKNFVIDSHHLDIMIDYYCCLCWLWSQSNNATGSERYYQRLVK